jgi:methylthioribose-1-phosphate isomerase
VVVIDQRLLPHRLAFETLATPDAAAVHHAIRDMCGARRAADRRHRGLRLALQACAPTPATPRWPRPTAG